MLQFEHRVRTFDKSSEEIERQERRDDFYVGFHLKPV
jgi:hypothetical protein